MNKVSAARFDDMRVSDGGQVLPRGVASHALASLLQIDSLDARGQRCLRSLSRFTPGEALVPFSAADIVAHPTRMTLQVSAREHIVLSPSFLAYVNHSCRPNAFFDVEKKILLALRTIAVWDEITFFYPSTEWRMKEPFTCCCSTGSCLGTIGGASQLPASVLEHYRLSPHIAWELDNVNGNGRRTP